MRRCQGGVEGPIQLDALSVLGPVRAVRWARCRPNPPVPTCRCGPSAGRWGRPDFLELSIETKPPTPGPARRSSPSSFVRGFTPERKQQPKTTLVPKKLVEQFLAQPR
jgi:hypothetical protein